MASRRTSLSDYADLAIAREIDSKYDDVRLVADNIDMVTTIATHIEDLQAVVVIEEPIVSLVNLQSEIIALANIVNSITGLYSDITVLNSIYADKLKLDSLFADRAKLDSLYADKNTLDTLYADKTQLDTVYNNLIGINAVYADLVKINEVANDINNINMVSDKLIDISLVSSNMSSIDIVVNNIDSTNIVVNNISNISTVVDSISDISLLANNFTDLAAISANMSDINNVANSIDTLNSIATQIVPNMDELLLVNDNAVQVAQDLVTITTIKSEIELIQTKVETSEVNAATSELNAMTYKVSAATSASNASISETNSFNSAESALLSKTNAATSEINALASENAAATSATNAAISETNAIASKTAAAISEANSLVSETNASTSANFALASKTAAENARVAAELALDSFTDIYLGVHTSAPLVDNDGNPLNKGALYFDSNLESLRLYDGVIWQNAAFNADGSVTSFNGRTGDVILDNTDVTFAVGQDISIIGTPKFTSVQLTGGTGTQGTFAWNADEETVDLITNETTYQIGQEVAPHYTKHNGVSDIPDGVPCIAMGTTGGSGKILVGEATLDNWKLIDPTAASIPAKQVVGVSTQAISNNGKITYIGKVNDIAGANYVPGKIQYVDEINGGLTDVRPTSGLVMPIAFSINSDTLMVRLTPINELDIDKGLEAYALAIGIGDYSEFLTAFNLNS